MTAQLARVKSMIDVSGVAARIELMLPAGVRPRQLSVRTLLIAMTLAMLGGRDALLTGVHKTLTGLPQADQRRLGVIAHWKTGPHQLTYRQLEYTYRLISKKVAKDTPDGSPSQALSEVLDRLLEASVQVLGEPASSSYAVDWTDQETFSRPPPKHAAKGEPQTEPATGDRPPAATDPGAGQHPGRPAAARHARAAPRPRSVLGTPHRHPPNHPRDVLRLLPASRHRRLRRARPRAAQARQTHPPRLMRPRPAARARARHPTDGRQRHHDRRPAGRQNRSPLFERVPCESFRWVTGPRSARWAGLLVGWTPGG